MPCSLNVSPVGHKGETAKARMQTGASRRHAGSAFAASSYYFCSAGNAGIGHSLGHSTAAAAVAGGKVVAQEGAPHVRNAS